MNIFKMVPIELHDMIFDGLSSYESSRNRLNRVGKRLKESTDELEKYKRELKVCKDELSEARETIDELTRLKFNRDTPDEVKRTSNDMVKALLGVTSDSGWTSTCTREDEIVRDSSVLKAFTELYARLEYEGNERYSSSLKRVYRLLKSTRALEYYQNESKDAFMQLIHGGVDMDELYKGDGCLIDIKEIQRENLKAYHLIDDIDYRSCSINPQKDLIIFYSRKSKTYVEVVTVLSVEEVLLLTEAFSIAEKHESKYRNVVIRTRDFRWESLTHIPNYLITAFMRYYTSNINYLESSYITPEKFDWVNFEEVHLKGFDTLEYHAIKVLALFVTKTEIPLPLLNQMTEILKTKNPTIRYKVINANFHCGNREKLNKVYLPWLMKNVEVDALLSGFGCNVGVMDEVLDEVNLNNLPYGLSLNRITIPEKHKPFRDEPIKKRGTLFTITLKSKYE